MITDFKTAAVFPQTLLTPETIGFSFSLFLFSFMEIKYLATLFPSMIKALLAGKRRWVLY